MTMTVLVADDDLPLNEVLCDVLSSAGYEVLKSTTLEETRHVLERQEVDVVLLDKAFPDGNGLTLLGELQKHEDAPQVIVITSYGEVESAVAAMKMGAWDFITKPFENEALLLQIEKAGQALATRRELARLRKEVRRSMDEWIVGKSPTMRKLTADAERVAPTNAGVLITGENGTGKDVLARLIHNISHRADGPFVPINCATLGDLLESEIFGHEKGAFTGADRLKKGLAEVADGGTLFLDEVTSMRADVQAKLLRFLESRTFRRVGGVKDIKVDVRVIAATNQDIRKLVSEGSFRQDLYFRLAVVSLHVPPLRERREDIPLFVAQFINRFSREMGKIIEDVSPTALEALMAYDWPGNIRELRNAIERAVLFCDGPIIELAHLPAEIADAR